MNILSEFIGCDFIDTELCHEIISYFESSEYKEGKIGDRGVDKSRKDTQDTLLDDSPLFNRYGSELQKILSKYIENYPFSNNVTKFNLWHCPNIQRYDPPTGHYNRWHCERSGIESTRARHLAFMTYLNTVPNEGATEFFHQNLKVFPEEGKTLIWPVDWTFTHRGNQVNTYRKYIVTGWLYFAD